MRDHNGLRVPPGSASAILRGMRGEASRYVDQAVRERAAREKRQRG
jgi:hypothetical protein